MTDSIDIFDLPSKIISIAAWIGAGCNVLEGSMRQPYSQTLNDAKVGADEKAAGHQNCVKLASADMLLLVVGRKLAHLIMRTRLCLRNRNARRDAATVLTY